MIELYIVRHGIAVPHGTPGVPENERPLTAKGEVRMRQIGRGLVSLRLKLDRIVTSPLPRALQTARIVSDELECRENVEVADALSAGVDATVIRDWLNQRSEQRLMIVGHNPALSELVGLLVTGHTGPFPVELKKGGIAALASTSPHASRYEILWIAPPRLLRRLNPKNHDA
jgi:phosphohistidine phosphatase